MGDITSMLVPLQTLAGWPAEPDPSTLHVLGLLVGLPLVAALIISGLVKARTLSQGGRGSSAKFDHPAWLGAKDEKDEADEILGTDNAGGQAAAQGGPAISAGDTGKGGASARW